MYTIDLTLKYTPIPVSVQRKEVADVEELYQKVTAAMRSTTPELIELTCEKELEKKIAVMSDQIGAIIVSQKDGAAATGRVPGFFSLAEG
jgi:hypothetical protein